MAGATAQASTYVRPEETPPITWASTLGLYIIRDVVWRFPDAPIGIEGLSDPKGYNRGKLSPTNPKYLIRAGITLGVIAGILQTFLPNHPFVVIPPKNNGSKHISMYPDCLSGRRPKELLGSNKNAGTRNHEKSAYDVAGEVERRLADGYKLDELQSEFISATEYDQAFQTIMEGTPIVYDKIITPPVSNLALVVETVEIIDSVVDQDDVLVAVGSVIDDEDNPLGLPPEAHTKSRRVRGPKASRPRKNNIPK